MRWLLLLNLPWQYITVQKLGVYLPTSVLQLTINKNLKGSLVTSALPTTNIKHSHESDWRGQYAF